MFFRFTLPLGHQQNESTPIGVLFSFCCDSRPLVDPSSKCNCILNWVRIFDQVRCQLASIRSGENSSAMSLPACFCVAKVRVTLA